LVVDEAEALKYIFKNEFSNNSVIFNGKVYSGTDIYLQIFNSGIEQSQSEKSKGIDTSVAVVERMTESQFLNWKKGRLVETVKAAMTGREIWEAQQHSGNLIG